MIYLDTHVVAWLYGGSLDRFSEKAIERLRTDSLRISPVVELELQYLYETGHATRTGEAVVKDLGNRLGLVVCERPFKDVMRSASRQNWTRDPFDRIIVGHAALETSALLTKDQTIRTHYAPAIW